MLLARLLAGVALIATAPPARALDSCFTDSVGRWRGPVLDAGEIMTMNAVFTLAPDGTLAGTYRVLDASPYDGALSDFRPTAPCEADFVWTDRYGTGVAHIRFEPEQGRFLGAWGRETPVDGQIFDGYRIEAAPAS